MFPDSHQTTSLHASQRFALDDPSSNKTEARRFAKSRLQTIRLPCHFSRLAARAYPQLLDHNARADADPIVEIHDVIVVHADAAVGDKVADRARLVRTMNGILAAGKRHRRIAHRVTGRTASDHLRQVRFVASHRGGRPRRAATKQDGYICR